MFAIADVRKNFGSWGSTYKTQLFFRVSELFYPKVFRKAGFVDGKRGLDDKIIFQSQFGFC